MLSPKCPNCGLVTKRTVDWVCQWCGYPLLSRSYPKIPKTYQQLKQEQRDQVRHPLESIAETTATPKSEIQRVEKKNHAVEFTSTPNTGSTLEPATPVSKDTSTERLLEHGEQATEHSTETIHASKTESGQEKHLTALASESEIKHDPKQEPEAPENTPETEADSQTEIKPEMVVEVESTIEPEPSPQYELTIDELFNTYEKDGEAADIKLANQIIQVTGVVGRIEIKDTLDIPYITLTSNEPGQLQSLRCSFDKRHRPELSQFSRGQTITVQGKYDGSIIDPRMKNCRLNKNGS